MNRPHECLRGSLHSLRDLAGAVVEASRVPPGAEAPGSVRNLTGGPLVRPGGGEAYAGFWIRDFALSLGSGLISRKELEHAILLTASSQAMEEISANSGSLIPRWSIPDHITPEGVPIFFPGTDLPERQGQPYGARPSLDDSFFFVDMVWHLVELCGQRDALRQQIAGTSLLERLDRAFQVIPAEPITELAWCDERRRGVSFGFTDTVVHTGLLLFCSLLKYRAAQKMCRMHAMVGLAEVSRRYEATAEHIAEALFPSFGDSSGLLRASTGKSSQPDVWGSAFALAIGALPDNSSSIVKEALLDALHTGTISWKGSIRHIPTDRDFSKDTAWENTVGSYPLNRYQNGAYWGTPTGWVCRAIAGMNEQAAVDLAAEYLKELAVGDFRKGEGYGSPYECMHPDGDYRRNPLYMTSVTVPLAEFIRLGWLEARPHQD